MSRENDFSPAEQVAHWADKLRDMSAMGLIYATDPYDRERYHAIQDMVIEMLSMVTNNTFEDLEPLKKTVFSHVTPFVVGNAGVIDSDNRMLLMRRSDNGLWTMPGGAMEVGESPAEGVVREVLEETGVHCKPVALVGIYDSNVWDENRIQQMYKFTFLCEPTGQSDVIASHAHETLDTGWFKQDELPSNFYEGHLQRLTDSFDLKAGKRLKSHFDF